MHDGGKYSSPHVASPPRGWIGVDLDGTLAHYDGWRGADHIGPPIGPMVERVKAWRREGREVRIVTARVAHHGSAAGIVEAQTAMVAIMDWCARHLGEVLPVTCTKDPQMVTLWDDRAVGVMTNRGEPCCEFSRLITSTLADAATPEVRE